jgi:hypothetical protein
MDTDARTNAEQYAEGTAAAQVGQQRRSLRQVGELFMNSLESAGVQGGETERSQQETALPDVPVVTSAGQPAPAARSTPAPILPDDDEVDSTPPFSALQPPEQLQIALQQGSSL